MASATRNPLGAIVQGGPALRPSRETKLTGRYVTVVGMTPEHIEPFYSYVSGDENAALWDYMLSGPFHELSSFRAVYEAQIASQEMITYAFIPTAQPKTADGADNVVGCASYIRFDTNHRTAEVGSVMYSPALAKTPAATEAMYLMAKHAFEDLGYRRYEWKCNALNGRSWRAALRLGFKYEGTFRQHMIVKGRSRDTAWFSIVDEEWEGVKKAMERWLDEGNFDRDGRQRRRLESFKDG
ncbi:acyl-CoA N-acyltransferase [Poronia punctata]|nr:acyl-CoA N-acyltransferase [Poronia punctata]